MTDIFAGLAPIVQIDPVSLAIGISGESVSQEELICSQPPPLPMPVFTPLSKKKVAKNDGKSQLLIIKKKIERKGPRLPAKSNPYAKGTEAYGVYKSARRSGVSLAMKHSAFSIKLIDKTNKWALRELYEKIVQETFDEYKQLQKRYALKNQEKVEERASGQEDYFLNIDLASEAQEKAREILSGGCHSYRYERGMSEWCVEQFARKNGSGACQKGCALNSIDRLVRWYKDRYKGASHDPYIYARAYWEGYLVAQERLKG